MLVRRRAIPGALERHAQNVFQPVREKFVCLVFNPAGNCGVGWSAVCRIVFETAVVGRIVRWRDNYAVCESCLPPLVVCDDRMRYNRCRGISIVIIDHHCNVIRGEHFQRRGECGCGQRVCIYAEKQRAVCARLFSIKTDRLCYREDVILIESSIEC